MTRRRRRPGAWLVLLLAGPLLALGVASFVRRIEAVRPLTGVEWVQSSAGPVALAVEPHGPASRAGLRVGDLLVAANGRPVPTAVDAAELAWDLDRGAPPTLTVRRGATELQVSLRATWQPRGEPYAYLALVGLAFWVSGLFIALKWPMIRGGSVYPLLAMAVFANLVLSHTGSADPLDRAIAWADLVAGLLVPPLLLHVGFLLAKSPLRGPRAWVGLAYGLSLAVAALGLWLRPDGLGGSYRFADPLLAVESFGRLQPLLFAIAWLLTIGLLVKAHTRTASVSHRGQVRWLLWGLAGGLGPFVTLYAVPWAVGASGLPAWAEFLAVAPMALVPGAFTAALARYRLHDLDVFLLRGITEVSAVFGSFAVLAAAIFVLREWVAELLPLSRSATRYIGFLVAAVAYPQMRVLARAAVERAFYRRRYSYRATLLDWARELNAETDLASLLHGLRARVRDTLGISHAQVLLRTDEATFEPVDAVAEDASLSLGPTEIDTLQREPYLSCELGSLAPVPWARYLFPMRIKGHLRAVLATADREPAEEPLTSEDRALLSTLSAHAATAIEAARLFQEVRRRAEEIERLHARQAKILESSAVGLLLLDGEGRIQAWNRALEAIYGLEREQAIGRGLGQVFPLHVVRRIERQVEAQAPGEEARIFRLSMVNRNGNRVLVNLAISPVDGDDRDGGARVVTFDDVTQRVKLEEQLLRQERLASLGLLAAGVAHEINTPLTGISSYAQMLLEETAADDPRRPLLEKIEAQTQRAAGITRSLLNLARPERADLEPLDLNRTLHEVLQLFEPQLRRSGIRLRTALADNLPPVLGHRGKLQQVFLNLLMNARDALDGQGNLTVLSYRRGGRGIIEVTDDGVGIAEEDLPRIFDPFFTTKGRGQGTGLGLSISYGIVREHRGEITVESNPGQYTRFRVELPLVSSAQALA